MISTERVRKALQAVDHPEHPTSLVDLGMIRDIAPGEGRTVITVALPSLDVPVKDQIVESVASAVSALHGAGDVSVELAEMTPAERQRFMQAARQHERGGMAEHLNDIRHVIAVMSGKGGVGKSLVAGLLAVALRRAGNRVGILDADITGPSIPKMFFPNSARPGSSPVGILPAETVTGIKVMSINLLLPSEDQAVVWRGPLISGAIKQFWGDVFWGDLDYLVVDLPPGTSDASLTVMQSLPLSGIVLVSSPQDLAGMVVRKAAQMAQHLAVPILGLVENMSYAVCPHCGERLEIFGPSKAEAAAARLGIVLLGRIPLDPEVSIRCDAGQVEEYPAEAFAAMAKEIASRAPAARTNPALPK
jgi:Mrp family chromosome partitioning ATPase